jgi:hypothetical protein
MRKKIAEILVKWSMPTRQVAINELFALFDEEWERAYDKGYEAGCKKRTE